MPKKHTTYDVSATTAYRFCGDGRGIPGLPHELTVARAFELGLQDLLRAAIRNGNYKSIPSSAAKVAEPPEGE
jgi:hypothetical protein